MASAVYPPMGQLGTTFAESMPNLFGCEEWFWLPIWRLVEKETKRRTTILYLDTYTSILTSHTQHSIVWVRLNIRDTRNGKGVLLVSL